MIRSSWVRRAGVALAGGVVIAVGAAGSAGASTSLWASVDVSDKGTPQGFVSAWFSDPHVGRLDILRNGAVVATSGSGGMTFSFVVQPGDELVVTDMTAGTVQRATVTGRPTLDATVCDAATMVSGSRDAGTTVTLRAFAFYGRYDRRNAYFSGQVTTLTDERFIGSFSQPIRSLWRVYVTQTQKPAPDLTFTMNFSRRAGSCPPSGPAPDTTRPSVGVVYGKVVPASLYRRLRTGAITTTVTVNEPSTVNQVLYLDNGAKLPAATAAAKKRVVLGSGQAAAGKAGAVKVKIKLSKSGRSRVRRARSLKLVLVTTVRDVAGNTTILPAKKLTAKRAKAKR